MSTEVIDAEVVSDEEATPEGVIEITIGKDNVSYDTNMSIPDMVFWMKVVEDLAMKKALGAD